MPSVTMHTAKSSAPSEKDAAEEIATQLGAATPKVVFMFATRGRDHSALNAALRERLPKGTRLVGASTGGELDNGGYSLGGVVVGALSGDIDVGIGLGKGLSGDAVNAGSTAIEQAATQLGKKVSDLDPSRYVAAVIDDGSKMKKEEFLLGVLEKNQSLVLVGGGAQDTEMDPSKASTLIHVDGEVVDDAVMTVLFHTQAPWAALRSHWYEPVGAKVRITKYDSVHRQIIELDGRPAADRYSEILGVPKDQLTLANVSMVVNNCLGLKVGREYFIRAAWKPFENDTLQSMNMLAEDQELEVMRAGDMVALTKAFIEREIPRRVKNPHAALFFDCVARRAAMAMAGKLDAVGGLFAAAPPCAGFTVNFETYCGFQISGTLTSLIFGSN
ncbi:hypothetical protein BH09MYX1_BH09MYX1_45450 [soil metagenome]